MIHIVLYEPEIPSNTGAIIRLAANTGSQLHLIKPYGFSLDDKKLRRAGLDYREYMTLIEHDSLADCLLSLADLPVYALTTKTDQLIQTMCFEKDCVVLFGSETKGLGTENLANIDAKRHCRLPMVANSRSLNLANAVSVVVYEAWRQQAFIGGE